MPKLRLSVQLEFSLLETFLCAWLYTHSLITESNNEMSSAKRHASLLKWDQGNDLLFILMHSVIQSLLAYCSCYFQRSFPRLQLREALNTWSFQVVKEQQWMLSTSGECIGDREGEREKKWENITVLHWPNAGHSRKSVPHSLLLQLSRGEGKN